MFDLIYMWIRILRIWQSCPDLRKSLLVSSIFRYSGHLCHTSWLNIHGNRFYKFDKFAPIWESPYCFLQFLVIFSNILYENRATLSNTAYSLDIHILCIVLCFFTIWQSCPIFIKYIQKKEDNMQESIGGFQNRGKFVKL